MIIDKYWIAYNHWLSRGARYTLTSSSSQRLPINHSSGDWVHGFEFNNDHFLLLGII